MSLRSIFLGQSSPNVCLRRVFCVFLVGGILYYSTIAYADSKNAMFGHARDREILQDSMVILNHDINHQISLILERLLPHIDTKYDYTVRIIHSSRINAFATFGGYIYLTTGLLDILKSKDELAAVLAHEIAHIEREHLSKEIITKQVTNIGFRMAGAAVCYYIGPQIVDSIDIPTQTIITPDGNLVSDTSQASELLSNIIFMGYQSGEPVSMALAEGHSDVSEMDADKVAISYLQSADIPPEALATVLKKIKIVVGREDDLFDRKIKKRLEKIHNHLE